MRSNNRTLHTVFSVFVALILFFAVFMMSNAGFIENDENDIAQTMYEWKTHIYLVPTSDGLNVLGAVYSEEDICESVKIDVENRGQFTPIETVYLPEEYVYRGTSQSEVFETVDKNEFADITRVLCSIKNSDNILVMPDITVYRYFVEEDMNSVLQAPSNAAALELFDGSLLTDTHIIAMSTKYPPGSPPENVEFIGLAHTFRIALPFSNSEGDMELAMYYNSDMLPTPSATQTLKIYAWIPPSGGKAGEWVSDSEQDNITNPGQGIPYLVWKTKRFTTFVLGYELERKTIYLPIVRDPMIGDSHDK